MRDWKSMLWRYLNPKERCAAGCYLYFIWFGRCRRRFRVLEVWASHLQRSALFPLWILRTSPRYWGCQLCPPRNWGIPRTGLTGYFIGGIVVSTIGFTYSFRLFSNQYNLFIMNLNYNQIAPPRTLHDLIKDIDAHHHRCTAVGASSKREF